MSGIEKAAGRWYTARTMLALALTSSMLVSEAPRAAAQTPEPTPVTAGLVSFGETHACAVVNSDRVACWGSNANGQFGRPDDVGAEVPHNTALEMPLNDLGSVAAVAAGSNHTCVLFESGVVGCAGANYAGQLGSATGAGTVGLFPTLLRVDLPVGSSAVEIGAGSWQSCAVLDNGEVVCWGVNQFGNLGPNAPTGTGMPNATPVAVPMPLGETVTQLSVGTRHNCVRFESGRIGCWGSNLRGELAMSPPSSDPVQAFNFVDLPGLATSVTAGTSATCAVLESGEVYCWGSNQAAYIGPGSINASITNPRRLMMPDDEGAISVSLGLLHGCALLVSKNVACWGSNNVKQVGQVPWPSPNLAVIETPALVVRRGDATEVTAGRETTCVRYASNTLVRCWGSDRLGQVGSGQTLNSPGVSLAHPVGTLKAPFPLDAVERDGEVELSWTPAEATGFGPAMGWAISKSQDGGRSWDLVTRDTGTGEPSYTVTGLVPRVPVEFRVTPFSAAGFGSGGRSLIVTPSGPPPPEVVLSLPPGAESAIDADSIEVLVTFDGPVTGFGADDVYINSHLEVVVDNVQAVSSSDYVITLVRTHREVSFSVVVFRGAAVNSLGQESLYSNELELRFEMRGPTADVFAAERRPRGTSHLPMRIQVNWDEFGIEDFDVDDIVLTSDTDAYVSAVTRQVPSSGAHGDAFIVEVWASEPGEWFIDLVPRGAVNAEGYPSNDVVKLSSSHPFPNRYEFVAPLSVEPVTPMQPARLLDTRTGANSATVDGVALGAGKIPAGGMIEIPVAGRSNVPADATSAMLNITAIRPDEAGFATLFPCGPEVPNASSLNFASGSNVANSILVGLSERGTVCLSSSSTSNFAVDAVAAARPESAIEPLTPARLLDTRRSDAARTVDGVSRGGGSVGAGDVVEIEVSGRGGVPVDATSVIVNLAAIRPSSRGYATLFPCGDAVPLASTLNYASGVNISNATLIKLSDAGSLCLLSSALSEYALDVVGFVIDGERIVAMDPARFVDSRVGVGFDTVDGRSQGDGAIPAGRERFVQITGRGEVPESATAVFLNIVAVGPEAPGFLAALECNAAPDSSSLNYEPGAAVANATLMRLDRAGHLCVYSSATTDVIIDVVGYVAS